MMDENAHSAFAGLYDVYEFFSAFKIFYNRDAFLCYYLYRAILLNDDNGPDVLIQHHLDDLGYCGPRGGLWGVGFHVTDDW